MKKVAYWVGGCDGEPLDRYKDVHLYLQEPSLRLRFDLRLLDKDATSAERMMPWLRKADLIIADMTPERNGEATLGVHPRPVLAATLGHFLFLVPTYLVSIAVEGEVPYDWRHYFNSKPCANIDQMKSLVRALLSMKHVPGAPINARSPEFKREIFPAMPYPSPHFQKQAEKAADLAGGGFEVYAPPVTVDRAVMKNLLLRIEGDQAFFADFSTEDRSRDYPNANVLTEAALAKWVFRKKTPMIFCVQAGRVPKLSGLGDHALTMCSETMITIPAHDGNGIPLHQAMAGTVDNGGFPRPKDKWNARSVWFNSWARYFWRPFRKYPMPLAMLTLAIFFLIYLMFQPGSGRAWGKSALISLLPAAIFMSTVILARVLLAIRRRLLGEDWSW